jgi:hypothetical protein
MPRYARRSHRRWLQFLDETWRTLYLAHFCRHPVSAGAQADAASVMAGADATGRTKREKIIKANPFLERFTVADLKSWADRKMRIRRS